MRLYSICSRSKNSSSLRIGMANSSCYRITSYNVCYTKLLRHKSVDDLKTSVIQQINAVEGLEVEYFEVVDGQTLQAIQNWDDSSYVVACIAVYAGKIRLIDNVIYKNS